MAGFQHEVVLYEGPDRFAATVAPFVRDGLNAGEAVMVVVTRDKLEALQGTLGPDAHRVIMAPMEEVGGNPSRIIPAWRDFLDTQRDRGVPVRGVGEPIYAARTADELDECERHESLLNLAFNDAEPWRLLCPYDQHSLPRQVLARAQENHPLVLEQSHLSASPAFTGDFATLRGTLPEPPAGAITLAFSGESLDAVRQVVRDHAHHAGLERMRADDLLTAVNEIATNSVRHGGGSGQLRVWRDAQRVICEVRDRGVIIEPLIGRVRPEPTSPGGRGVWMANQLCDLVQIRSSAQGSAVRLHMRL